MWRRMSSPEGRPRTVPQGTPPPHGCRSPAGPGSDRVWFGGGRQGFGGGGRFWGSGGGTWGEGGGDNRCLLKPHGTSLKAFTSSSSHFFAATGGAQIQQYTSMLSVWWATSERRGFWVMHSFTLKLYRLQALIVHDHDYSLGRRVVTWTTSFVLSS